MEVKISVSQHSIYLLNYNTANDPQLEDKKEMDEVGALDVPLPYSNVVLNCPKHNKMYLEFNDIVRNGWRWDWCMNPPATFASFSATKVLSQML
jgi:hypothetical protein